MSKKSESSDSEDEFNAEALEEAVDKQMFKNLYFKKDEKESANNEQKINIDNSTKSNVEDEFQNSELTQSCKMFIAKKLNERLDKDIVLKNSDLLSENSDCSPKNDGIRLFNSSTAVLSKDSCKEKESKKSSKRKHLSDSYNQKEEMLKCKQTTVTTDQVRSQLETKFWTNRKPSKQYCYRKLENGKLLETN